MLRRPAACICFGSFAPVQNALFWRKAASAVRNALPLFAPIGHPSRTLMCPRDSSFFSISRRENVVWGSYSSKCNGKKTTICFPRQSCSLQRVLNDFRRVKEEGNRGQKICQDFKRPISDNPARIQQQNIEFIFSRTTSCDTQRPFEHRSYSRLDSSCRGERIDRLLMSRIFFDLLACDRLSSGFLFLSS